MLCNLKEILDGTRQEKRTVGSFNVYSYETIVGVMKAVEKTKSDAIISFGASYLKNMTLEQVVSLVKDLSSKVEEKITLHLDHCHDIEVIKKAIDAGFTSVMYDGSMLEFEENVANTKIVCDMAHEKNVSVEAELGSLALGEHSNETEIDHGESYTNPKSAKEFVERTDVDALAVSIGTVHGMYKGTPNIRIDILKEIAKEVDIPLVLHGGSGTPENIIVECINSGICKINVNTEISGYTIQKTIEVLKENANTHFSALSNLQKEFVSEVVSKYIMLFNNR